MSAGEVDTRTLIELPGRASMTGNVLDAATQSNDSSETAVDSVDFERVNSPVSSELPTSCGTSVPNAGGTGLVPPAKSTVDSVDFDISEPDELDPYADGGRWAYAEKIGGRIFLITQDENHPDTGDVLLTEAQIVNAVTRSAVKRSAWIRHDKDTYTDDDVDRNPRAVVGQPKPSHFHIVEERKSHASVAQVARSYGVPPQYVEPKKGRGVFLDLVEYLTHEHRNQIVQGKHRYDESEVHASFDWRAEVDAHVVDRASAGRIKNNGKKVLDALFDAVMHGQKTLKQVRAEEPMLYARNLERLQKLRQDFMLHQEPPRHRTNHYIGGALGAVKLGRTGKTQLARLFARALYPELDASECYHEAADKRVPLQNYKGQPVVIWDDYGPVELMEALGGRTGVWQVFDDHPGASDVNIKFGSVRLVHDVNIITRVTPYPEFFDGLAGDYTDRSGVRHRAEDARQSWGRFPFVTEVTENSFSLLVNQGFVDDTAEFKAFKKVATMRASFKTIGRALDSIENAEEREKAMYEVGGMILRPMLEHHDSLQPKPSLTKDEALASLFPSLDVLTGDAMVQYETDLAIELDSAAETAGLIAAQEWGYRYAEHFREAHLQGQATPEPGYHCGGCTQSAFPIAVS